MVVERVRVSRQGYHNAIAGEKKHGVLIKSVQPASNPLAAILLADATQTLSQGTRPPLRKLGRRRRGAKAEHALRAKSIESESGVVVDEGCRLAS